eukprot:2716417-Pyramimonas_sp.AAC.1
MELHRSPQWDRPHASWKPNVAFSPIHYSVSWPHRELRRRPHCYCPHALPPDPVQRIVAP